MSVPDPYPVLLEPILKEKVWGGRRLERFGKALPAGVPIGESWELADLDATDPSGGGGEAAHSRIASGALAGATLREAMGQWGSAMMGDAHEAPGGAFPLLVKFLDAREHLSVQVHPSPAYAAAHPDAHLKTECWFVLDAQPGSVIYKGVRPGVGRDDFERALRSGEGEGVVALLEAIPARVGDMHTLPSGTVHALGAGVLVAEVQTPSDTTFRVYDWALEYGRQGRTLHIEPAMACIDFAPAPAATRASGGAPRTRLVENGFFTVDLLQGPGPITDAHRPACVVLLEGEAMLTHAGGGLPMRAGQTALVPAACAAALQGAGPALVAQIR